MTKKQMKPVMTIVQWMKIIASTSHIIGTLNTSLHELGESPLNKRKVQSKCYASTKI